MTDCRCYHHYLPQLGVLIELPETWQGVDVEDDSVAAFIYPTDWAHDPQLVIHRFPLPTNAPAPDAFRSLAEALITQQRQYSVANTLKVFRQTETCLHGLPVQLDWLQFEDTELETTLVQHQACIQLSESLCGVTAIVEATYQDDMLPGFEAAIQSLCFPGEGTSYGNIQLGLMLQVPAGWQVQVLKENQLQVFGSPEAAWDGFCPRMSYTKAAADDPSDAWFEDFIVGSKAQQATLYENYQIIQEERFQLGQYDAYLRIFQWQREGIDVITVNAQAIIRASHQDLYIAKAESLQPLADRDLPLIEAMIRSTRLLR